MPQNHKTKTFRLLPVASLLTLCAASSSALAFDFDKAIEDALKFGDIGEAAAGSQGVTDSLTPTSQKKPAPKDKAGEKKPVSNAFQIKTNINYRYENVNQDDVINPKTGAPIAMQPKTANANTIRTRLGILTPVFQGLQGYVEYEGTHVLQSDYNNGSRNNKPEFSSVADPGYNELNQLWIAYTGVPDTMIKGGRQLIKLDNERFIGTVDWRQLQTTYDAVVVENKSIKNTLVTAGYIGNVQNGNSTIDNLNAPILNVNYKVGEYGNLVGYGYWLNFTEKENWAKSNQTYGIRFDGATPKIHDHYNLLYTAEWSAQRDYEKNPNKYQADRINVMGGFNAYNFTLQGAMEQLGGYGAGKSFITPLGTNHSLQGWADLFLVTPGNGLRDVFGTVTGKFLENDSLIVTGAYHDFSDDTGKVNYGTEWDFQALKKFGKHYSVLAKYAYFNDSNGKFSANATDTQKVWVQGNVSF